MTHAPTIPQPTESQPTIAQPDSQPLPSLRTRAISGARWALIGYAAGQAVRFIANIILARLLVPELFGLILLVNTVIQGLQMFSDIGVGPAIIRSKRAHEPAFLNTAWTVQAARGLTLWAAACALAWPLAAFYDQPELLPVLIFASFGAVFAGLNSTALFTQNRKLAMGRLALIDLSAQATATAAMITWALLSPTIWALAVGGIAGPAVRMLLSYLLLPKPRNRLAWDRAAAAELFSFGKWIFLSTVITFFALQSDKFMLAKLIDPASFGVFAIALGLVGILRDIVRRMTNLLLYPALAEVHRNDAQALHTNTLRARKLILTAATAATTAIVMAAPPFFALLYKPEYANAAWMAQLLTLPIWFGLLQSSADRALLAAGDSRAIAVSNTLKLLVTIPAALVGIHYAQTAGFIIGVGAASLVGHAVIALSLARHNVNIIKQDLTYTLATATIAAAGLAALHHIGKDNPLGPASIAIAAAVSLTACAVAARRIITEIRAR